MNEEDEARLDAAIATCTDTNELYRLTINLYGNLYHSIKHKFGQQKATEFVETMIKDMGMVHLSTQCID